MPSRSTTRRPAQRALLAMAALFAVAPAGVARAEIAEVRRTPIVRAVQSARPAVVNIQGQKSVDDAAAGSKRQVNGMGTGVVIDPRGYVLTNHHVVDGVRQIRVTLDGGARHLARIVAHDRRTDLAVIKIDAGRRLPTIPVGRSSDLMPGEPVIAVGNAYGYEHTVTRGIVSALGRDVQVSETQAYDDLIQTDASINPGNSGGPLLSIEGKMIGLNVAVRAGAQGIGFAIPVDDALDVAARLVSVERLESKWHGLETAASADGENLVVRGVASGSPAAAGGVRRGDVIERLGDVDVERRLDVERALLGRPIGERVAMRVRRAGRPVDLRLAVSRRGVVARNSPVQRASASTTGAGGKLATQTWELLGLRLDQASAERFADGRTQYRGGMRVVDVRRDGPAAAKGIRSGDVLVGMHIWETASDEDLRYIV
ncbi:MAG: trypsin-like peptidase domain-containing protein, partial [Planctomycetota bacterium]